ncbi:MAG: peptidoglycan recognition family protein [Pseudomonadota bacterium]
MNEAGVVVTFSQVFVPLSMALGLSLMVERVLEFLKNVFERVLGPRGGQQAVDAAGAQEQAETVIKTYEVAAEENAAEQRAESAVQKLQDLDAAPGNAAAGAGAPQTPGAGEGKKRQALQAEIASAAAVCEIEERVPQATVLVQPATDPDLGWCMRGFTLQLLGFATGIVLAHYFHLQLFGAMSKAALGLQTIGVSTDYLLTGLLIGGGSGPIHELIRFISERKVAVESKPVERAEAPPSLPSELPQVQALKAPVPELDLAEWQDISYEGGVDREKLESVHKRQANPDLIVYHHTAMNRSSRFEDVVKVIHDRDWLTGYHCVITEEGAIHWFCRWDRSGNHAVGYNRRSLGIAFNGNFEPDRKVPFSNPDGRYGPPVPAQAQLESGARVIALWALVYGIAPDFDNSIIPHSKISTKTCPGSNFPRDRLHALITRYCGLWQGSPGVMRRIEACRQKLYVNV